MITLIKNGTVISSQNNIHSKLNIIIDNGIISTFTNETVEADTVIDAEGLIVCPGFVDIHMHEGDNSALACLLRQGVTSGLAGNCGENRCNPELFLNEIAKSGSYINMGLLAGYSYFREKYSKASKYESISPNELSIICNEIQKALDEGCIGVSFGLEYIPGISFEEMITCSKLKGIKLISSHIRSCANKAICAISEMIDLSSATGVPVQISHIGGMAGYGNMSECLELIEQARNKNVEINCDCYPYLAYSTAIGSAVYDDDWQKIMNCSYEDIEMCEGKYRGKRCTKEIFENERLNHPEYLTVGHVLKYEDIKSALNKEYTAICSDAYFVNGSGHPRAAGAFVKYISESDDLDKAIYKCTALPAKIAGFKNKGNINIGNDGDLVIFNLQQLKDKATFDNPTLPPEGIEYVLIRGNIAVCSQNIQNDTLGRPIFA